MSNTSVSILDCTIDTLSSAQLLADVRAALQQQHLPPVWIVTANPEIVLAAHHNAGYRDVVAKASHRVADGTGVVLAARVRGVRAERITGGFLLQQLFALAAATNRSVHIILHAHGLTRERVLRQRLIEQYPHLRVFVSSLLPSEPPSHAVGDIVINTFGAPVQEQWIARFRDRFSEARCFVGVGGALDVYCGVLPKPPRALSRVGLEWLWRLMIQPKRWRRILRAVFVFPITFFFHRQHA